MKKALAAILLLVYLTVSTGFSVSLHYCMNKLASADIGAVETDTCGKCGMEVEEGNGCCRDEVKVVKLTADHFATQWVQALKITGAAVISFTGYFTIPYYSITEQTTVRVHGPPFAQSPPAYLLNGVFRI
jgi:hypothetical protein